MHLDSGSIAKFQRELGAMRYKFQFVSLAGFRALNYSMYFDDVTQAIAVGLSSATALRGSAEQEQFH